MKLSVRNLGVIRRAEIDLSKPISIFTGYNNTGKTYLSYLIYATSSRMVLPKDLVSLDHLRTDGHALIELTEVALSDFAFRSGEALREHVGDILGLSEQDAKQYCGSLEVICKGLEWSELYAQDLSGDFQIDSYRFRWEKASEQAYVTLRLIDFDIISLDNLPHERLILAHLFHRLTLYPLRGAEVLPVERNSIYTFKTELSLSRNALVDQLQEIGNGDRIDPLRLINQQSRRYPMAVRDCLRTANDLVQINKAQSTCYELAEEIERELLGGEVRVSKEGDVVFSPRQMGKRSQLAIALSASVVKTLSSLVLYLRHTASVGDLLIIDEPEMNLHPEGQIRVARLLARLYNRGIRLVISTHSDYVIREFNNMIMAQALPVEVAEELGYKEAERIATEDIACYHFVYATQKKVDVRSLPISRLGVSIPSIDQAIEEQNQLLEELYTRVTSADAND